MKKVIGILLIAIALTLGLAPGGFSETEIMAPEFSLKDTAGNPVSLSDYKGKQGALLFFWTTWCPFCREQLKFINDKYAGLTRKGLVVLGINVGEPAARVVRFLKNYSLKYKVLLDEYGEAAIKYRLVGVPTYVLVDKQGNIVYQYYYFPTEEEQQEALK